MRFVMKICETIWIQVQEFADKKLKNFDEEFERKKARKYS